MPAKWFLCPDREFVEIEKCLQKQGCRMGERCATRPYLRMIAEEREFTGQISPSAAGNGPRYIILHGLMSYAIDPADQTWRAMGSGVHFKLSIHRYTNDVFSEETLRDNQMKGIADVLDTDETLPEDQEGYVLTDYKTWGSWKVLKALGMKQVVEDILDDDGNPVYFKSGKKKGEKKTRKVWIHDGSAVDGMLETEYQLNRYRIFFEQKGFPVTRIVVQIQPRDANTAMAFSRGIDKNIYIVPVKRMPNKDVLYYYSKLQWEVYDGLETRTPRLCNKWECWDGRRCKPPINGVIPYCAIAKYCEKMGKPENWKGV